MNPKLPSAIQLLKNLTGLLGTLVLLLSCNADSFLGQISVDKIVNPDNVPPIISFSTIPSQVSFLYNKGAANNRAHDITAPVSPVEVTLSEPSSTIEGASASFTIGDCNGNTNYIITNSATPPAGASINVPCTQAVGGAVYNSLVSGANSLYVHFGDGTNPATFTYTIPDTITRSD